MDRNKKYTVLIVDDHPVFCYGMTELINKEEDLLVCGSIDNIKEARTAIQKLKPDMIILDISLKDGSGFELLEDLKREGSSLSVLVVSMYDESLYAERALSAGAHGYIQKQEAVSLVVHAIQEVREGNIYASNQIKDKIFRRLTSPKKQVEDSPLSELTARELEVFRLIGRGLSTKEISDQLHLSTKTVGTYRENIKSKLQLKHYTELVKAAVHWSHTLER